MRLPDLAEREAILRLHSRSLPLAPDIDFEALAAEAHGYSGADLAALCREAAMEAITAAAEKEASAEPQPVSSADFAAALRRVGSSLVRGLAAEVRVRTWEEVGGLEEVKRRLRQAVEWPLVHAGAFERLGLRAPRGVLLHGPPGCAKTTLACATAHQTNSTFIPLACADLFSMFTGEGEAILRDAFTRARAAAPSIIFLDEIDGVAANRATSDGTNSAAERLLSVLLTEMDGVEGAGGVVVVGATNRPHALDAALLRPGRFDVAVFVPPPDEAGRLAALAVHTRAAALAADADLAEVARRTPLYTGAELRAVCREASLAALREDAPAVAKAHFHAALAAVRPALDQAKLLSFQNWQP
mmetsp:Transcript_14303/g.46979  ORF Transcript_14303/g.46979 Transcript_14303/m.46979 type:complete len:358 (-) Transcript_14303:166-1239(-)